MADLARAVAANGTNDNLRYGGHLPLQQQEIPGIIHGQHNVGDVPLIMQVIVDLIQEMFGDNAYWNSTHLEFFANIVLTYDQGGTIIFQTIDADIFDSFFRRLVADYRRNGPAGDPNVNSDNRVDWGALYDDLVDPTDAALGPFTDEYMDGRGGGGDIDSGTVVGGVLVGVSVEFHAVNALMGGCHTGKGSSTKIVHQLTGHTFAGSSTITLTTVPGNGNNNNCAINALLRGFDRLHCSERAQCTYFTTTDPLVSKRIKTIKPRHIRFAVEALAEGLNGVDCSPPPPAAKRLFQCPGGHYDSTHTRAHTHTHTRTHNVQVTLRTWRT